MKEVIEKYLIKIGLIWAGCFVLFFFAYILMIAPQKKTKKHLEEEFAKVRQSYDLAQKAGQKETREKWNTELEHLQEELKKYAIDFEDSTDLTFDISRIADESQAASFAVKTRGNQGASELPGSKYLQENYIDISFTAGFRQFLALLSALEKHKPVIFVDKFKMTRSGESDFSHPVDMNLAVFVRKRQDDKSK